MEKDAEKEIMVCEAAQEECEEACRECEEAIKECEEAALSCRYLLSVCVIIIILLGSLLIYLNLPYDENGKTEELTVYYIMPAGCDDCDPSTVMGPASDLGVDVISLESESFSRETLFVIYGDKIDFTAGDSELNFLGILCYFAQNKDACILLNESVAIAEATACVENYNVSKNTVFFYTQDGCEYCSEMESWIRDLKKEGYEFYTIDLDDEEETEIADECLSEILDLSGGIPQFACAGNGKAKHTAFSSIEDLRAFSDECASA